MVYGVSRSILKSESSDVKRITLCASRNIPSEDANQRATVSSDEKVAGGQKDDVSVIQSILSATVSILSSAVNIINIAGCRPNEPVNPYADPSIPEAIGNSVEKAGAFKGAEGYVKGSEVYMKTSNLDGGLYVILNAQISGNLSFSYSGSSTNHVTIQFIHKYNEDTNPTGDDILFSEWILPEEETNSMYLEIPEGTDKIVIMQVGSGESEILMTDTVVTPKE